MRNIFGAKPHRLAVQRMAQSGEPNKRTRIHRGPPSFKDIGVQSGQKPNCAPIYYRMSYGIYLHIHCHILVSR